ALVGCLTVVLALWTVVGEPRPRVRALGLTALLAVVLQGVLGGVTVLYKLPLAVSVTHACLAQAFFCLTVTLALVTGAGWTAARPRDVSPRLARLAALTTGLVFAQLVLGALMRHMGAGLAIPDFPLAFGRLVPPLATPYITVHFAHRVGALVVAGAVAVTAGAVFRDQAAGPWLRRPAPLADYLTLTKPRVVAMVLVTTAAGYYLGSAGTPRLVPLLHTLAGTALAAAGTLALNQYLERDLDARMERTRHRPLPEGRLHAAEALGVGLVLLTAGLLVLAGTTNAAATLVTAGIAATYLLLYTPLKPVTSLCSLV